MNNPEYLQIDDVKYKINTDYRYVLRFQKIAKDKTISNEERCLATIYVFFGEEGINNPDHYERLLKGALKYVQGRPNASTGKTDVDNSKPDMDYEKDWNLITTSIRSEYGIDITKEKIHWWAFFDLLNGLSSECALNKVRQIRNTDLSKITDEESRKEMSKLKKIWSLDEEITYTKEQQDNIDRFYKLTGIDRE